MIPKHFLIGCLLSIQVICAGFFIVDLIITIFGFRTTALSWQLREFLEITASLGLLLGSVLGGRAVIVARRQQKLAETALRSASTAFAQVIDNKFSAWGLTKSEKDVTWFVIKGFSNSEISKLRGSSEGTVKAQLNAVYRKSGSVSRAQMISILVEDLLMVD